MNNFNTYVIYINIIQNSDSFWRFKWTFYLSNGQYASWNAENTYLLLQIFLPGRYSYITWDDGKPYGQFFILKISIFYKSWIKVAETSVFVLKH